MSIVHNGLHYKILLLRNPEVFLSSHKNILSSEFRANAKIDQGQVQNDQGQLINYLFYLFISFIWPNGPTF